MSDIKNATKFVLLESKPLSGQNPVVGLKFDQDMTLEDFCLGFQNMGFQATNLGNAIAEINRMLSWRLSDEPFHEDENDDYKDLEVRKQTKCFIWLGFTSNLISSGLREIFLYLAKNKLIDAIVTTAGGVEEDFVKVLGNSFIGDFTMKGKELRENGWNRIGNIIVPNDNYVKFESWVQPILDKLLVEQKENNTLWTPSKIIHRLGKEINDESSLFYWCYKNNIPTFCPGITDGSFGDNLFFHSYRNPGLVVDVVSDIRRINDIALKIKKSGVIILGGGLPKHHICNANLMRNGSDFAVYISTAQEYDGSDSGARPDEAVSWGKIKVEAVPVKVHGDATIIFPLVVAATFKPYLKKAST